MGEFKHLRVSLQVGLCVFITLADFLLGPCSVPRVRQEAAGEAGIDQLNNP